MLLKKKIINIKNDILVCARIPFSKILTYVIPRPYRAGFQDHCEMWLQVKTISSTISRPFRTWFEDRFVRDFWTIVTAIEGQFFHGFLRYAISKPFRNWLQDCFVRDFKTISWNKTCNSLTHCVYNWKSSYFSSNMCKNCVVRQRVRTDWTEIYSHFMDEFRANLPRHWAKLLANSTRNSKPFCHKLYTHNLKAITQEMLYLLPEIVYFIKRSSVSHQTWWKSRSCEPNV